MFVSGFVRLVENHEESLFLYVPSLLKRSVFSGGKKTYQKKKKSLKLCSFLPSLITYLISPIDLVRVKSAESQTCPADLGGKCSDSDEWQGEFFPGIPQIKYEVTIITCTTVCVDHIHIVACVD